MEAFFRHILLCSLLLSASTVADAASFMVSPALGIASETDGNVKDSTYIRVDGSFYPLQHFGVNVFLTAYEDFKTQGGVSSVSVSLSGGGVGVIGRWRLAEHLHTFIRADYLSWQSEATIQGHPLGSDSGGSFGAAAGFMFTINSLFGLKVEALRYNDISGSDFNHLSLAMTFEL